jgi:hypothetical protein
MNANKNEDFFQRCDIPKLLIDAFKLFIWLAPSPWVSEAKDRAVLCWSSEAAIRRRRTIKFAMRFDPHQQITVDLGGSFEKSYAAIATVIEC